MVLLRCFDRFDLFARLGEQGDLNFENGPDGLGPIDGLFASLETGQTIRLYRSADRLRLGIDQLEWDDLEVVSVTHRVAGDDAELSVEHGTGTEVVVYPAPREMLSLDSDPTPFVSDEDADFGLFVAGVFNDPERAARLFRSAEPNAAAMIDVEQAIAVAESTDWARELAGANAIRAITDMRQLLLHPDTAVVAVAADVVLKLRIARLSAHLLDVLGRSSQDEERQDIILNSMVGYAAGNPAGLVAALREVEAADPGLDVGSGLIVVEAAFGALIDPGSDSPVSGTGPSGRHVRRGTGEYFENEIADRWVLRHWGYWGEAMALMGLPVAVESDVHFRCDSSSLALRSEVADYLDAAPYAVTGMKPPSPCYLCDRQVLPAAHRSDGVWLWPEYMGHLVRDHEFVVPNAMVDHIREVGRPPADLLGVDVEQLPWP